ncbi:MAG: sodium-dependent transporter, partial [Synechococcus sp.]
STLGTIFIALPTGLSSLGASGQVVAVVFFALAYLAAITSAVSLLEVPVACLIDRLGWSRPKAVWVSAAVIFVLGLPAATSLGVLGWMDSVFGGVLLILGGLLLAVLLGWVLPSRFEDDLSSSGAPKVVRQGLMLLLRWVAPPVIAFGLLVSVWDLLRSWFG